METSSGSGTILPWLLLLLAGSGCAALIYEIVWFQLLQLVIGSTVVLLGLLLAAYMGGLCLGSAAFSRLVSARENPLRVYALLELGIGAFGIIALFGVASRGAPLRCQCSVRFTGNGVARRGGCRLSPASNAADGRLLSGHCPLDQHQTIPRLFIGNAGVTLQRQYRGCGSRLRRGRVLPSARLRHGRRDLCRHGD